MSNWTLCDLKFRILNKPSKSLYKARIQVLGLEQFSGVAHDKGSSHGSSRIIRLQYHEHPDYVPLLHRAYELWRDLEADSGKVHKDNL